MEPSQIITELAELTALNRKGVEALFEAEEELAHAEAELDTVEARAFLSAEGSVAERTAKAKLEAAEARLARDIARASVNRVRTKLRTIESELMALATRSKIMQAEMKL
jgi:multidrug efflux pump subunit AcrA (membrane-fusion protein)